MKIAEDAERWNVDSAEVHV